MRLASYTRNSFAIAALLCWLMICQAPAFGDQPAAANAGTTTWQAVPESGVISNPGLYYLPHDVRTDRLHGITIDADDVTLDLGGHAFRNADEPKEGSLGIVVAGHNRVTICHGTVGGFWFNVHGTQNQHLRIHDMHFDDIPYIAINAAQSTDLSIIDNLFENFRYDLKKDNNSFYVIGINASPAGAIIANNRFSAVLAPGAAKDVAVETVFVLFSADVSKDCHVVRNNMSASEVLPRSYGVWIATQAQASVIDNTIDNMKYGICVAEAGSLLAAYNRFHAAASPGDAIETTGISALTARDLTDVQNSFDGITFPKALPKGAFRTGGEMPHR